MFLTTFIILVLIINKSYWIMVYFGVFLVLLDFVPFSNCNTRIPDFNANILSLYSYLRMPSLSIIHGWLTCVAL